MPNTSNLGLPYPTLNDAPNPATHIQALASAADAYWGGRWTSFNFNTAASIGYNAGSTTQSNAYKMIGDKTMLIRVNISLTGAGVAGSSLLELGPLPAGASAHTANLLHGMIYRNSGNQYPISVFASNTRLTRMYYSFGIVSGTAPWAWTTGDVIRIGGVLELI